MQLDIKTFAPTKRQVSIVIRAILLNYIVIEPPALLDGGFFMDEILTHKKQFHLCIQNFSKQQRIIQALSCYNFSVLVWEKNMVDCRSPSGREGCGVCTSPFPL